VIPLSPEAELQLDDLLAHHEQLERPEAIRNLVAALGDAAMRIKQAPNAGFPSPRPYPSLASLGLRWIKEGAYWFAYTNTKSGPVIAGVFYQSADIPNRL
jgi:plasmid stabilization system protein ParE